MNWVTPMSKIIDTTDFVDTSMMYKSKLSKNFFGDNYWIESMQNKIDADWRFASNVVDMKEQDIEKNEQGYVIGKPKYHDIEVRINAVYDEKGLKLSDDYKNLIFQKVEHPMRLGTKYYFDVHDFSDAPKESECTWLTVNFDTTQMTANSIVRRCSINLGFLINGNTTEWYEPAILDYDPKYTINRANNVLNIVKSETYATVQYNEYTKNIKVNDRFIFGSLDFDNIANNSVFKVKEVFRFGALNTDDPNSIPMLTLALDRDLINPDTDLVKRDPDGTLHYIADYYIEKQNKDNNKDDYDLNYYLKITPDEPVIYEGQSQTYDCTLYDHYNSPVSTPVTYTLTLPGTTSPSAYFEYSVEDNHLTVKNLKRFYKNNLQIVCTVDSEYDVDPFEYQITLGEKI